MPDEHKFEQQGQNVTGPQTNIAGDVQGPVLSGRFERIQSIITTGNNSPVFLGYERLRDAVIQPDEVFRRVHIESFIGRRWLINLVDSKLNDENNSCGYLVLEAHAGLGKTAFLAWLVKERNYIHHFIELAPGQEGIEKGLKNLAAQIILAYKLSADEAIPDAAGRPDYLYRLLSQAADKRDPGERIVVVVDALDEAGTPPNQNVLGLPKVLPDGVFFIVSMRPVQVTLHSDRSTTPRWPLKILAESRENLDDLKSFLEVSATWPKVKRALDVSRYTTDDFIDALMKKSQGLWIYLHFVIPEIERGERSPLDLDKLPEGLQEYYAGYWARWRKADKWYGLYLPILTTLAAAQEPSTLERIMDWSGIEAPEDERFRLKSILKEEWRPYLAISGEGEEEKYRFYHATVREFFEGKAEHNSPMATENDLADELYLATRERHRVMAERCLAFWGGLEKGLPDLMNKRKEDDGYGLRHLAAHLEASGQDDELHHLLKLETSQGRNLWHEAKEVIGDTTGYINDVMRAWRLAEEGYDPEDIEKNGQLISLQNRYALIFASINSLSGNIPTELLLALVEYGIWSEEEGLAHARHVPYPYKRAIILAELSSMLKEPRLLDEAMTTAREIQDEVSRAKALALIAPKLQDIDEALSTAQEIAYREYRAKALAAIAPRLNEAEKRDVLDEALTLCREIHDDFERDLALANIAPRLEDADEALSTAREIQYERLRAHALAEIAPRLHEAEKIDVLDEALTLCREIHDDFERDLALADIAPKLQDTDEALSTAKGIEDVGCRAWVLATIAPQLPDTRKEEVLVEALAAAREIQDKENRAELLAAIAPKLRDDQRREVLDEVLTVCREIHDDFERSQVLAAIAPKLQDDQRREVLDEALTLCREIHDDVERDLALADIAPRLEDADEALSTAREIQYEGLRAHALAEIALKLQDAEKRKVLNEALATARKIQDDGLGRAEILADIAPRLQDDQRREVLDEALTLFRENQDDLCITPALVEIVLKLEDDQRKEVLDEALTLFRENQDDFSVALALSEIAPKFPDVEKRKVLNEALATARKIQDELMRAELLADIASKLEGNRKREVLDEALRLYPEIKYDLGRVQALAEIAQKSQDDHVALVLVREIRNYQWRAQALAKIAPKLPDAREALAAAQEIQDKWWRAKALEGIVLSLLGHESLICSSLWPPIIRSLSTRRRGDLLSDLSSLSPLVAKLGGDEALLETIQAMKDVGRWWP